MVASLIDNGPAKKSGIKTGDIILEFDGTVPTMRKLPRIVAETEVDKPVKVLVWRDGKKVTVDVTIGVLDETQTAFTVSKDAKQPEIGDEKVTTLGMTLSAATSSLRERFKLNADSSGVVVTDVADDGVAFEKGIRPGDLIVEVSQQEVKTPGQVVTIVDTAQRVAESEFSL